MVVFTAGAIAGDKPVVSVYPAIVDLGMVSQTESSKMVSAYVYANSVFTLKCEKQNELNIDVTRAALEIQKDGTIVKSEKAGEEGYELSISVPLKKYLSGKSIREIVSCTSPEFPNEPVQVMLVGFKE